MVDLMNLGLRRHMLKLPAAIGRRRAAAVADRARDLMHGLTADHRMLHRFLLEQMPIAGRPLTAKECAQQLQLRPEHVAGLIDDLGSKKALIARDAHGAITWAYPITVDETPHKLRFESGDRLFAA